MPMIEVTDLVKDFPARRPVSGRFAAVRGLWASSGVVRAVDAVSFGVEPGEIVGYLGANGAGKSTTIKMLTGIVVPTSGTVRVDGVVPWQRRKRHAHNIGVVFGQKTQLWFDLPLRISLETIRDLYRVSHADHERRLAEFADRLPSLPDRVRDSTIAADVIRPVGAVGQSLL